MSVRVSDCGVNRVGPAEAGVGGDPGLLILLQRYAVGHESRPRLHDDATRLEATWHIREVACGRGSPPFANVIGDGFLRQPDVAKQGGMVEGEDYVEGAVRPHLDTSLTYLVDYVLIVPLEKLGDTTNGRSIHLTLTRECGVSRGSLDRPAIEVTVCDAVPNNTPCPGLQLILTDDPSGDAGRLGPSPDGGGCLIS